MKLLLHLEQSQESSIRTAWDTGANGSLICGLWERSLTSVGSSDGEDWGDRSRGEHIDVGEGEVRMVFLYFVF